MDTGELFPFLHSTPVFPEWPLYARQNVDRMVSEEVQLALINRVERDLEERYGDMPARAFEAENVKQSAAFVADKMTSEAIELAASTIKDLADEIEAKRAEIEADDEDVIAVLLLGL